MNHHELLDKAAEVITQLNHRNEDLASRLSIHEYYRKVFESNDRNYGESCCGDDYTIQSRLRKVAEEMRTETMKQEMKKAEEAYMQATSEIGCSKNDQFESFHKKIQRQSDESVLSGLDFN